MALFYCHGASTGKNLPQQTFLAFSMSSWVRSDLRLKAISCTLYFLADRSIKPNAMLSSPLLQFCFNSFAIVAIHPSCNYSSALSKVASVMCVLMLRFLRVASCFFISDADFSCGAGSEEMQLSAILLNYNFLLSAHHTATGREQLQMESRQM